MEFIFVRHGEPMDCYNDDGEYRPKKELGLSENGKKQAKAVGKIIKAYKPKYLFSSDYPRALETAQEINNLLDRKLEIKIDDRLRDHHIFEDVNAVNTFNSEGKKEELLNRSISFIDGYEKCKKIINEFESQKFDGNVLIATHSNIMEMFKYCIKENHGDYELYSNIIDRPNYSTTIMKNTFCKAFTVDLSLPREKRVIKKIN